VSRPIQYLPLVEDLISSEMVWDARWWENLPATRHATTPPESFFLRPAIPNSEGTNLRGRSLMLKRFPRSAR
jgi:hypothetical protein